ncbi:MAG TPA: hypothetical protein VKY74_05180 [Chloroflexia bacterium]|nr:hypothetical protein [Chloroflexia bacterium]
MDERDPTYHEIKIDLQGLIRLLAKNLYAEADVFVRELIQNAHDSLQRRAALGGDAPAGRIAIGIDYRAGTITFADNGQGLTEAEIHAYLSTIGRSGTGEFRAELARRGRQAEVSLIGQFGIGLLSAFVVAGRVEVDTRSATPGAPAWRWISEGQHGYELRPGTQAAPGTTVTLHLTESYRDLLDPEELRKAIKKYADFIPFPIYLNDAETPANVIDAPWHRAFGDERERLGEYQLFVTRRFPDSPLEVIPVALEVPHRVAGVLYVSERRVPDINTAGLLDVYQTRMFLMANSRDLLPLWAKFVRGVIDSPDLTPTAARDAIQLDARAQAIKEALGALIVRHLQALALRDPARFTHLMDWHAYHMTGMAVAHDDFFDAVADLVPFPTNRGLLNLGEYMRQAPAVDTRPGHDLFYFSEAGSATQFYLLCDARGLLVINASDNFTEQFLRKYARRRPRIRLHHLTVAGSAFLFEPLGRAEAAQFRPLELDFQALLPDTRSQARIVRFLPADLPAVTVLTADTRLRQELAEAQRSLALPDSVRDLAGQLFAARASVPVLLHLNAANPAIGQMAALARAGRGPLPAYQAALRAIYHTALLLAQHQVTAEDAQAMATSFNAVIALLLEQTGGGTAAPAPAAPALPPVEAREPILCVVALPAADGGLEEAIRAVLEGAPYYWQVVRVPPGPPDPGQLDRAQVYLAEVSDRDPAVLLQLGYMWGSRAATGRLVGVLEGEGARLPFPTLPDLGRLPYPTGTAARRPEALRAELAAWPGVTAINGRVRAHALAGRVLYTEFGVDAPLAEPLAAAYPTMEQVVAAPLDTLIARVPGLARSLARGLQAEMIDRLASRG